MKHYTGILLVIVCTFLGTAAQILFKLSSNTAVTQKHSLIDTVMNPVLIGGFIAYGLSFLILTIALKEDDLSTLYPFIGLTYVWVSIISPLFFPVRYIQRFKICRSCSNSCRSILYRIRRQRR